MSKRKVRPAFGTPVDPGTSIRDAAAALGVSKTELSRWTRLAQVPEADFEAILASAMAPPGRRGAMLTAQRIIDLSQGWDRSQVRRAKVCPHCGKAL